jgi:hypothetical protein
MCIGQLAQGVFRHTSAQADLDEGASQHAVAALPTNAALLACVCGSVVQCRVACWGVCTVALGMEKTLLHPLAKHTGVCLSHEQIAGLTGCCGLLRCFSVYLHTALPRLVLFVAVKQLSL